MIRRISKIKGVGTFENFTSGGAIEYRKLTLIYGENCTGKSTLASVIRSFGTNNPALLEARATIPRDGSNHRQSVELSVTSASGESPVRLQQNTWTQPSPRISIFDATFINDTVYSGDSLTRRNREKLTDLIVGAASVGIQRKIDWLVGLQNNVKRVADAARSALEQRLENPTELEAFLATEPLQHDNEIDIAIDAARENLTNMKKRAESMDEITEFILPDWKVPVLDTKQKLNRLNRQISVSLIDPAISALEQVTEHVSRHMARRDGGETEWLRKGAKIYTPEQLDAGTLCPFCGNPFYDAVRLVTRYRHVFDEAFDQRMEDLRTQLKQSEASIRAEYDSVIACNPQLLLSQIRKLSELAAVPAKRLGIGVLETAATHFAGAIASWRAIMNPLLTRVSQAVATKRENMTALVSPVSIPRELDAIQSELTTAIEEVMTAWKSTRKGAEELVAQLKTTDPHSEVQTAEKNLRDQETLRARTEAAAECDSYIKAISLLDKMARRRTALRKQLEESRERFVNVYGIEVQKWFKRFGSRNFEVTFTNEGRGSTPVLRMGLSFRGRRVDPEALSTMMSESDKRALALAIFWAELRLKSELELKETIVVLAGC